MPGKYNTGGVVSGTGGQVWGGKAIDEKAASMGTTYHNPNTKDYAPPGTGGGSGSKGTKSSSKPTSKGM